MEFQLEFLFDHMLVISFWYVLLVEPSSCNLHEGTLVFLIQGGFSNRSPRLNVVNYMPGNACQNAIIEWKLGSKCVPKRFLKNVF